MANEINKLKIYRKNIPIKVEQIWLRLGIGRLEAEDKVCPEGVEESSVNLGVTDGFREIDGLDEGGIVGRVASRLVHSLYGSV